MIAQATQRPRLTTRQRVAGPFGLVAHVSADLLLILVGFWLAYLLRYKTGLGGQVSHANFRPFQDFLPVTVILGAIVLVVFAARGVYRFAQWASLLDGALQIGSSMLISFGLLTGFVFYAQAFTFSRLTFLYALVLNIVFLVAKWLVWLRLCKWMLEQRAKVDDTINLSLATATLLLGIVPMLLLLLQRWGQPDTDSDFGE